MILTDAPRLYICRLTAETGKAILDERPRNQAQRIMEQKYSVFEPEIFTTSGRGACKSGDPRFIPSRDIAWKTGGAGFRDRGTGFQVYAIAANAPPAANAWDKITQ